MTVSPLNIGPIDPLMAIASQKKIIDPKEGGTP
jgi:hypothetical protein